jgi:transcriptional regulator with XRE-family HTH domain
VRSNVDLAFGYQGRRRAPRNGEKVTIQGRELGRRLREAQLAARLDGTVLSRALGLSPTVVSRVMTGKLVPSLVEAAGLLALCKVSGAERDRILDLCHPRHDMGALRLSDGAQWEAFLHHADEAFRLIEYQPTVIPWLAQTKDYAEATLNATTTMAVSATGVMLSPPRTRLDSDPVAARQRATLLPTRLEKTELVIHEWALRAPIGDQAVRRDQMRHLLRMSKSARVSLWVIPASYPPPVTALSGFTILDFADLPSVVYQEEPASGVFLDDPGQVTAYRRIVAQFDQIVLDKRRSRELLEQIACADDAAPS